MATKARKKTYLVTKRWLALSSEAKITEVRQAVGVEGLEYDEAAAKLGASKGMVAGICFRNKIKKPEQKSQPAPLPPPLPKPAVAVIPADKPRPKLGNAFNSCVGTIVDSLGFSHSCGYVKAEGSEYCEYLHFDQPQKKV